MPCGGWWVPRESTFGASQHHYSFLIVPKKISKTKKEQKPERKQIEFLFCSRKRYPQRNNLITDPRIGTIEQNRDFLLLNANANVKLLLSLFSLKKKKDEYSLTFPLAFSVRGAKSL